MKKTQKVFTEEFKKEAVRLAETSPKTIEQLAVELGVGFSTLNRWKAKPHLRSGARKQRAVGQISDKDLEIQTLKRDLKRSREETEILKKATAYFVLEQSRNSNS